MFQIKLKQLREHSGLSQRAFAEIFGVAQSTVGMWESGKREPDFATTQKIADFFNVSINYLLEEYIEPNELRIARSKTKELHETNSIPNIQTIEEKTGTSYATFRSWYNGMGDFFNDKLYLIADLYNVSIDYLLGREDEALPKLNNKDQKEIKKILDNTKEQLLSQDGLMFDGVPATDEDVQKIIMAMQMGMEMIKKENKAKFTPKKYRDNN